ncbi:MAG: Carbon-nitrogen hydrolase [bacterium ADurb.Bin400]|nr:MAG: Carbon-nitrogen hydrolase [bacterium ADurb.Bin400]
MESYLKSANESNLLRSNTIVVYPEYIGTWLVSCNLPAIAYQLNNISVVMAMLAARNFPSFIRTYRRTKNLPKTLFLIRAKEMRKIYHDTFSLLAQRYGVTIVAGSIVLPKPSVRGGVLQISMGDLHNVSVTYGPDGEAHEILAVKSHLIEEEQPFTTPGISDCPPIYQTPAGKLAVLICADSWHAACYQQLRPLGALMLAVPSFLSRGGVWNKPWHSSPEITEKEAWLKHAMAGQLKDTGIRFGINVFLRGRVWGIDSDGQTIAVRDNDLIVVDNEIDNITNLWL